MGGLRHLFYRILPIITLICFLSFGIMQITQFGQNITYLQETYIDKTTGEQYTNPTQEQINNSYEIYTFDLVSYTNNIDQDILTRAVNNTTNFSRYTDQLDSYRQIWADGYQLFDVSKTIANGVVTVINTLIFPINILLIPIRITAGILLTAFSLIGININTETIIHQLLRFFLDDLAIPFILLDNEDIQRDNLTYTTWQFHNGNFTMPNNERFIHITGNFTTVNQNNIFSEDVWSGIWVIDNNGTILIYYDYYNGVQTLSTMVYNGTNWINNDYKTITFLNNGYTDEQAEWISTILSHFATRQLQRQIEQESPLNKNQKN